MRPELFHRLERMTPEELAGQMLILGFPGQKAEAAAKVLALKPAGVSLLPRNLVDARQTAALTGALQAAAAEAGAEPLLIGADQEGGAITAVADGTTLFPGAMALGAAGKPELTEEVALAQGREAAAMGINLNYAPVADVNSNPRNPIIGVRSFGDDPVEVARHVAAAVRGYRTAGILATAKHFPGHGAAEIDTHLGLPVLPVEMETMVHRELPPFRAAIAAGVDAVMTAHIVFPALDRLHPATLSAAILAGLLRQELGFNGLILTDCLEMEAISSRYEPEEYALAAVEAGADLLLVSHTYERQVAVRDAIAAAVRRGTLARERVAASVARVLSVKERLGLYDALRPSRADLEGMLAAHGALAERVARAAVTEVWNDGILPLAAETTVVAVWPEIAPRPRVGDPAAVSPLGRVLAGYCRRVIEIRFPAVPGVEDTKKALFAAAAGDVIVAATAGARPEQTDAQIELVRALLELGKPVIVLALRTPYDLRRLRGASAGLAVYDPGAVAVRAAAEVIFGRRPASGRLPVAAEYVAGGPGEKAGTRPSL
ncbi:MAG: glycoside hydrolase family 3 protein [Firmicutes bacterium]|nr:glycoside hydrolase family 3 protein [Bacillota bacterium]